MVFLQYVVDSLWYRQKLIYRFLQVHRICFALALFHLILSSALVGVQDTRDKRAAIQNG